MSTGNLSVIETVDSESGFVSSGGSANTVAGTFTSTYDPNNYAYYLRIDLIRNSTSANETVYGVALQD